MVYNVSTIFIVAISLILDITILCIVLLTTPCLITNLTILHYISIKSNAVQITQQDSAPGKLFLKVQSSKLIIIFLIFLKYNIPRQRIQKYDREEIQLILDRSSHLDGQT